MSCKTTCVCVPLSLSFQKYYQNGLYSTIRSSVYHKIIVTNLWFRWPDSYYILSKDRVQTTSIFCKSGVEIFSRNETLSETFSSEIKRVVLE